jgi:hypothetical protein
MRWSTETDTNPRAGSGLIVHNDDHFSQRGDSHGKRTAIEKRSEETGREDDEREKGRQERKEGSREEPPRLNGDAVRTSEPSRCALKKRASARPVHGELLINDLRD